MINYIKNKFSSNKTENKFETYSKYFPDKIYLNKCLHFDGQLLFKDALFDFPSEAQFVKNIVHWTIDGIEFEEIELLGGDYKLVYDSYAEVFYFLSLQEVVKDVKLCLNDFLEKDDRRYESWFNLQQLDENRLLKIFIKNLNESSDEYVFVEVQKDGIESVWAAIVLLPNQIT